MLLLFCAIEIFSKEFDSLFVDFSRPQVESIDSLYSFTLETTIKNMGTADMRRKRIKRHVGNF